MPRPPRVCLDGVPLHVFNRGNRSARIFLEDADFIGFLKAMKLAATETAVRVLAFCLMTNHFHLVLWPVIGREIPAYMQIVMNAHIRDLQPRHGTTGTGHIYKGRYRSSAILSERHLLTVLRYVEANPVAAGLVARAEDWRWSSISANGPEEGRGLVSPWPIPKPADWLERVNQPVGERVWRKIKKEIREAQASARFLKTTAVD